jgi:imidazoleglycerol-phosphate dehydratase/histidinol-phosphatase
VLLAKNLGAKAIWLNNNSNLGGNEFSEADHIDGVVALETTDWQKIYEFLKLGSVLLNIAALLRKLISISK